MDHGAHDTDDDLTIDDGGDGLTIRGEIDADTAPRVRAALAARSGDVAIDMSETDFIDSSGLRVLIEFHQIAEERGDRMTIVDPSTSVQRVFELSALDGYFNIEPG
jgi:anti-sigma B factor antagonist